MSVKKVTQQMKTESVSLTHKGLMKKSQVCNSQVKNRPKFVPSSNKEISKLEIENNNRKSILSLPLVFDAIFRGAARYLEYTGLNDSLVRVPFRFLTETVRYGTSASVEKLIDGNKIGKEVWFTSLRKALENTTATVVFEPNKYTNRVVRVGVGFANMFIRFAARVGLLAMNFLSPEEAEIENVADEFLGRSLLRSVYIDSEKPFLGIIGRTIEQLGINAVLAKLPIKNKLLSKLRAS